MSYEVLARKWRPRRFEDLVGQVHVVRALTNALNNDRMHHAFLFTGTRGVGKTTIARIIAKALNCETGVSGTPCGECQACHEVDEGRFVDLIEVDAASRTKVDDTRELLDNVQYAPSRGRYKIYLIDEVHMLSGHSFNALLKTLEEPPPHVKFLLATTNPKKLPVTVLSRCLQFNLKRLTPEMIEGQLNHILESEQIKHDAAAVAMIARAADGSMRDGLSLLDQAIAYSNHNVNEEAVGEMLGTIDRHSVEKLLQALADNNPQAVLQVVAEITEQGNDYEDLLNQLLLNLHQLSLAQIDPEMVDGAQYNGEFINTLAKSLTTEDIQLYYQIGAMGRNDLSLSPDPRTGLEMVLLRMLAFRPVTGMEMQTIENTPRVSVKPGQTASASSATITTASGDAWQQLVANLPINGLLRELLQNSSLLKHSDDEIQLMLDESCAQLFSKERQQELGKLLNKHFGKQIKLKIEIGTPSVETPAQTQQRLADERQQAAEAAIYNDPNVKTMVESFNGRINPDSIRPKQTQTEETK